MSQFQKDVELLRDLDELVKKIEKQANPDPAALAMLGAMNPIMKAATPHLASKGKKDYDTITRVRARLVELMAGASK